MSQPTRVTGSLRSQLENATALGSLIRPRAVTRCNLAVSDMYMRDFGKTHQIAYTYCSVGRVAAGIVSQMVLWVITPNVTVYACI